MLTKKQVIEIIKDFFHKNPDSQYFMQLKLRESLGLPNGTDQLESILDELESEEVIGIRHRGSLRPGIFRGTNFK